MNPRQEKSDSSDNTENLFKLGWLLIKAEVISADTLELAIQLAGGFKLRVGQVLVEAGRLSENDLENALRAQELIRNGELEPRVACKAVGLSHRSRLAFDDAVARASWFLQEQVVVAAA